MHPFQSPFRNQNPVRGGNYPFLNQFPRPSGALSNQFGLSNPQILMPTMPGVHNQSGLLDSLLAQQQLIQHLQNNFIASLSQVVMPQLHGQQASLSQGVMPQLHRQQLNLLGGIYNPNLMSLQLGGLLGQPSLNHNLNQMMGFSPNGFICSQNPNFTSNSQLPVMNYSSPNNLLLGYDKPRIAQITSTSTDLETQEANKKLQKPILQSPVQNKQSSGEKQPEMSHSRTCRNDLTNNSSENVFINDLKNVSENREPLHTRSRSVWNKQKTFSRIEIGGKQQRNERNTKFSENNDITSIKSFRAAIYSESEVQKWREARKKNFPTRAKIEKKLELSRLKKEDVVEGAKTHLQELKEVLAKQAELGIQYHLPDKKEQRFRHDNKNAKRRRFKKETPRLINHKEDRADLPVPEDQPSNTSANEASIKDTQIRHNRSNNMRGKFRRGKKNAKKRKVNEEAPVLVNHEEEGTNHTSGC